VRVFQGKGSDLSKVDLQYSRLVDINDYEHLSINYSLHFRDPDTGVHTNAIEGTWYGMKTNIPVRNRTEASVDAHLWE
jgi:hypothetical protein